MNIADIRKDYQLKTLSENDVLKSPFGQFNIWWNEALASEITEVNAMTLATISANGMPDARIVLLKGFNENGFVFFTNYQSAKGYEMAANPYAALVFFWKELERQVRIIGKVEKISTEESDEYFHSRPLGSQMGAWASPQSKPIKNREEIEKKIKEVEAKYANENTIDRPPFWGGYKVVPSSFEFWQGRSTRLHDRIKYFINEKDEWNLERLAP